MKVSSSQQYSPNFGAKLISQWKCVNGSGNPRNVSIVSFESSDLGFIKSFRDNLNRFSSLSATQQAIIDASTNTISAVLQNVNGAFEKVRMFMAIHDGKPCGFLIANIPKRLAGTNAETYSSRHNPAKNETEIDWLVTWSPNRNENIKGIGKAIVGEYFKTVCSDKFRDVFVRSEVPEKSNALFFYQSMGFERLGQKRIKLLTKNNGQCFADIFSDPEDDVIPMIITRSSLKKKVEELSKKMCRCEFVKNSIDLEKIMY